jgi:hypothetical protein
MDSTDKANLIMNCLLDRQAYIVLPSVLVFFLVSLFLISNYGFVQSSGNKVSICNEPVEFSQSVMFMTFSALVCFSTFAMLNVVQILNRIYFLYNQPSRLFANASIIKIYASNLLVCIIAGGAHALTYLYHFGGICRDDFG